VIARNVSFTLNLTAKIGGDGTARLTGVIRLPAEPATAASSSAPVIFTASGAAEASCADLDGDGTGGVSRLAADFREIATGDPISVVLIPIEHDVDANGAYAVTLRIGDETLTGDARVRVKFPWLARGR
jgi:hypothetical protein